MKCLAFLIALLTCTAAAQYTPRAQQVLALAPRLEAFAGSKANLETLVRGLTSGNTIMLSSITPDGMREEVIFTPAGRMPARETARLLEAARQALAARGMASPGPRDIGAVLMGGMVFTPTGATRVAPMVAAADRLPTSAT